MTREEKRLLAEARQRSLDGTARTICRAANVTVEEIVERAGVSSTTAWRWMEGRSQPRGRAGLAFGEILREAIPEALANLEQVEAELAYKRQELANHERAIATLRTLAARAQSASAAA